MWAIRKVPVRPKSSNQREQKHVAGYGGESWAPRLHSTASITGASPGLSMEEDRRWGDQQCRRGDRKYPDGSSNLQLTNTASYFLQASTVTAWR